VDNCHLLKTIYSSKRPPSQKKRKGPSSIYVVYTVTNCVKKKGATTADEG
jgi:hypothetical protein